jgi:hypothetical protein
MARIRDLVALLALAAILAACASAQGPSQAVKVFGSPNPVSVTEHLDAAMAASAVIDSAGGTLTATGSNGVKYTLTVPKDALLFSTRIRITPLASLDGLPFHALIAGAHLEPDGLTLTKAATLTIEGAPAAAQGDATVAFMYEHTGANLHLYPRSAGTGLKIDLLHFSSPGVGDATNQQFQNQLQHPPNTNLAQEEQKMAELVAKLREGALLGVGPSDSTQQLAGQLQKVLDAFKREVLDPEVAAALAPNSTYDAVSKALTDLFTWERQAELFGLTNPGYDTILKQLLAVLPRLYQDEIKKCVNDKDVNAGLRAFAVARASALLGQDIPLDDADKCLQIKVNVDSHIKGTTIEGVSDAEVKIPDVAAGMMKKDEGGTAPPAYAMWSFIVTSYPPSCTYSSHPTVTGPAQVLGVEDVSLNYEGSDRFTLKDFTLDLTPGTSTDTLTVSCPVVGTIQSTHTFFNSNWEHLHGDEQASKNGQVYYAISGWTIGSGATFAKKTYNQTKAPAPQLTVDEQTTITVSLANA